jgi:uncharacterized protein (TIGR03435 family)
MLRAMAVASLALGSCHAFAQSAAPRPEFEAASIKLNKSEDSRVMVLPVRGGRFTASNIPLQYLVTAAYGIKNFQLSGAPPWFLSERFDIEAKAAGNPSFDAMLAMFQTLFEDRLQLKFHHETKELPVYTLVVSKPGKLRESDGVCDQQDQPAAAPCRFMILRGHLGSHKATASQLVDALSRVTDQVVLDKSNLAGTYDINLNYTPDEDQFQAFTGGTSLPPPPSIDPNGPSLFTALQEQLGLKLESGKGPVGMILVIDHIERPSEN